MTQDCTACGGQHDTPGPGIWPCPNPLLTTLVTWFCEEIERGVAAANNRGGQHVRADWVETLPPSARGRLARYAKDFREAMNREGS